VAETRNQTDTITVNKAAGHTHDVIVNKLISSN